MHRKKMEMLLENGTSVIWAWEFAKSLSHLCRKGLSYFRSNPWFGDGIILH